MKHTEKEDNELIAEFMGVKTQKRRPYIYAINQTNGKPGNKYMTQEWFKYHSDWRWTMSVVNQIEGLEIDSYRFRSRIISKFCAIESFVSFTEKPDINFINERKTKIEAVYRTVVDFIKWYNSLTPPPSSITDK